MKILFTMLREENIDPLSVELISALAKREGHETFLTVLEHGELDRDLRAIRPDLVAFSAKTGESNLMFDVARDVKAAYGDDVLTIMGGPHPTFNYQRMRLRGEPLAAPLPRPGTQALPVEDTHMDFVAVGEGDEAWPELLRRLASGASADDVPGILTRTNRRPDGTIPLHDRANFLDDLPFHDRALVYEKTQLKYFGMRTFISQRGCPYPCTYCFNPKFNELYRKKGKTLNRYSVDRLLEELLDIKRNYDMQFIKFYDDIFMLRVDDWLREFCEKYPKVIGVPFHCYSRCDLVHKDPEMIDLAKAAGLHSISMSIESGNSFIREHTFRRTMSEKEIRFAFDYCAKKGVKTRSNTILAVPAPLIPKPDAPDFDEKAADVVRHLATHFPRIRRDGFESLLAEGPLSAGARAELTDRLRALGLRHTALEYDIEGLDINVDCRVTSGEFVMLSPFPGAPVTDYTIAIGAFDGDFGKLHEAFQSQSPFDCFTEEEKRQQLNISFLGVFLLVFPRLRNLVVKHLVKRPWTRFYFLLHFVARSYVLGMRIYPMRYSFRHLFGKLRSNFGREVGKHYAEKGRKFTGKGRRELAPASDVLGGPWKG